MLIPEERIARFEKMGFGLFVHWGLYSQLGMGEWTFLIHGRKMEDYKKLADSFTAEDFDARELARMAKQAGCRYITLTTRHHEGFSLYDTCGLSDFDAPHTPAGRDLIREFVDACREYDIMPFFYHTTLDWYKPEFEQDFDQYLEYLKKSVEVLCTKYGPIGGLWFDGNWSRPNADWKLDELYGMIRHYQPQAMIINNTGLGAGGEIGHPLIDSVTFEQARPTPMDRTHMKKYVSAEMCYTMNDHWGVGNGDFNYKSSKELIEVLCECRKVGANLLLNIGPQGQGAIPLMPKALLSVMGEWMTIFGEAIYEGKPYQTHSIGRNFMLKGDGCLYIFCFDMARTGNEHVTVNPGGRYCGIYAFSELTDQIDSVHWMDNNEALSFTQNGGELTINLSGEAYGTSYCVRVAKAVLKK